MKKMGFYAKVFKKMQLILKKKSTEIILTWYSKQRIKEGYLRKKLRVKATLILKVIFLNLEICLINQTQKKK